LSQLLLDISVQRSSVLRLQSRVIALSAISQDSVVRLHLPSSYMPHPHILLHPYNSNRPRQPRRSFCPRMSPVQLIPSVRRRGQVDPIKSAVYSRIVRVHLSREALVRRTSTGFASTHPGCFATVRDHLEG